MTRFADLGGSCPCFAAVVPTSRSLLVRRCFVPLSAESMNTGSSEKLEEWKRQSAGDGTKQQTHNTAPVLCVCLVPTSEVFS